MDPSDDFRRELEEALAGKPLAERKLLFVGVLNRHLPKGTRAVLVGGSLVEFYTTGAYTSLDIDLISDRSKVAKLLARAGFEGAGRHFIREDLGIAVEVPDMFLRPSDEVVEFQVGAYRIPAVKPEDVIVDRLCAAEFWRSPTDWEQALMVYGTQREAIDEKALERKAAANDVAHLLPRLRKESETS